jgi:hypothetical protein
MAVCGVVRGTATERSLKSALKPNFYLRWIFFLFIAVVCWYFIQALFWSYLCRLHTFPAQLMLALPVGRSSSKLI